MAHQNMYTYRFARRAADIAQFLLASVDGIDSETRGRPAAAPRTYSCPDPSLSWALRARLSDRPLNKHFRGHFSPHSVSILS